jgi:hypothetical protein
MARTHSTETTVTTCKATWRHHPCNHNKRVHAVRHQISHNAVSLFPLQRLPIHNYNYSASFCFYGSKCNMKNKLSCHGLENSSFLLMLSLRHSFSSKHEIFNMLKIFRKQFTNYNMIILCYILFYMISHHFEHSEKFKSILKWYKRNLIQIRIDASVFRHVDTQLLSLSYILRTEHKIYGFRRCHRQMLVTATTVCVTVTSLRCNKNVPHDFMMSFSCRGNVYQQCLTSVWQALNSRGALIFSEGSCVELRVAEVHSKFLGLHTNKIKRHIRELRCIYPNIS